MKQGITYCEIIEKYNTIPKPVRIETEKSVIKKQMVFPKKENLGTATEMYLFMENLTLYNNAGRNPNDDAPDSLALFGSEIIEEKSISKLSSILHFGFNKPHLIVGEIYFPCISLLCFPIILCRNLYPPRRTFRF